MSPDKVAPAEAQVCHYMGMLDRPPSVSLALSSPTSTLCSTSLPRFEMTKAAFEDEVLTGSSGGAMADGVSSRRAFEGFTGCTFELSWMRLPITRSIDKVLTARGQVAPSDCSLTFAGFLTGVWLAR
jgi:hypothetical protein